MSRQTGEHRLIDQFGRRIEYLRLSVTDRCDLRCAYCMPADLADYQDPAHWLSFEEIRRVLSVLAGCGLSRVRITGRDALQQVFSGLDAASAAGFAAIMAAIQRKPERHEFLEAPQKLLRFMSMTGG